MKRIAFVSGMTSVPWGGSEELWCNTAGRLLESGNSVWASVVRWPEVPASVRQLENHGAVVNRRNWKAAPLAIRMWGKLRRQPVVHPGYTSSWPQLCRFRPDVACISHGFINCGLDWMLRCLDAGIRYVSIIHANGEFYWPDDEQARLMIKAHLGAERSYFVSRANLLLFQKQIGQELPNAEVIRNPFHVSWNARPSWPSLDSGFRLACVGRLVPSSKGQDLLFEVLAKEKWRNRPLSVSLFGDGACAEGVRRLVSMYGLEHRVRFAGHVDNPEEIWEQHHALILPSRLEGLPISIVEAMLCGRLAIVTNIAGNTELIDDDVTGFVAAAPTVEHLDEAMERAWRRKSEWEQMGAAAAVSIREQVPHDPAAVLSQKLLALAEGTV